MLNYLLVRISKQMKPRKKRLTNLNFKNFCNQLFKMQADFTKFPFKTKSLRYLKFRRKTTLPLYQEKKKRKEKKEGHLEKTEHSR